MWPWTSLSALAASWKPAALTAASLALLWLGWHAHGVVTEARQARELREQIDARKLAEDRADSISREAEAARASLDATNRELARRTAHETTKPDYRTRLPDAGRLLYNAACCGAGAGQPDGPVPAADAPR